MDDIVPLFIYVVGISELTHLASELNFLEDYVKYSDRNMDQEEKLLTNLTVSLHYISNDWKIEEIDSN
jgi:hypothetical protein